MLFQPKCDLEDKKKKKNHRNIVFSCYYRRKNIYRNIYIDR